MKKCSMLKHTGYKWDTNQNDIGIVSHTSQNGYYQEHKQTTHSGVDVSLTYFCWKYKLVQPLWKLL
jgi:hypothetical protein